ncbi:MAG: NAD(P)/FAD-dependent oxidoreductase [Actinomycetota bacterium]|nr:NAD(P)/FAD-dependent oxidoreductase [Actinomycetota bacterium]
MSETERYDAVIVGGGHNGLVAAAYLARAGLSTLLLERLDHVGGAAVSERPFAGMDARLSRYSYLVSLLPQRLVDDLGLELELRSRGTASYTPVQREGRDTGLLVEHDEGEVTRASFRELTGGDREYEAWREFYAAVGGFATQLAPTLMEPLPSAAELRRAAGPIWEELVERPLGEGLEARFDDDTVRGVVLTDGLIGTFAEAHDTSLAQNRCFLYHLVGNGTGEWRVPVGGMGAVTTALAHAAEKAGATLRTGCAVTSVSADGRSAEVEFSDSDGGTRRVAARWVLSGVAPHVLAQLQDKQPPTKPEGAQLKINLLAKRLPRLRSGIDPAVAFAGTLHVAEGYAELQQAYAEAASGVLPAMPPGELYCHSLTDPSILGTDLATQEYHTLTYFGLHMPARLFEGPEGGAVRDSAVRRALDALNAHLEEPLEECLALDREGRPCLEAKTPQDIEASLGMPGGHIFHGDLAWPWLSESEDAGGADPARAWGVATDTANVLICGSGAVRGGAVSGLGGHNAAMAVLQDR